MGALSLCGYQRQSKQSHGIYESDMFFNLLHITNVSVLEESGDCRNLEVKDDGCAPILPAMES
jgi:hypothetical protein